MKSTAPTPILVSKVDLLRTLDISPTSFQNYDSKGLVVRVGSRQYDLEATCTLVIKHLRASASNHAQSDDSRELKEQKTSEEVRGLRLENAIKEGELIDVESIHHLIRKALVAQADFLESLPDALENRGILNPGMTGDFIKILDARREALLTMVLSAVEED
jgi:phage terminase Nu1 subunit (DNA packaging protein)